MMARAYELGNFNASLFSTEGIASVGPLFAPVSVFVCGLVIALANRLSSGLPPRFILISSAALPSDSPQRTAYHHVAVARRSDTFPALVHHAALVLRAGIRRTRHPLTRPMPPGDEAIAALLTIRTDHRGRPAPA